VNDENHGAKVFEKKEQILQNSNEVAVELHSQSAGRPHHTRFSLQVGTVHCV